jgi:post-segregation antitoxin (ccd killing protein)
MRMAKVSVSIPDEVVAAAKAAGINISRLSTRALADELDRRAKVAQLDAYLARLEAELGPVSNDEAQEAAEWAARLDQAGEPIPSESRRTA